MSTCFDTPCVIHAPALFPRCSLAFAVEYTHSLICVVHPALGLSTMATTSRGTCLDGPPIFCATHGRCCASRIALLATRRHTHSKRTARKEKKQQHLRVQRHVPHTNTRRKENPKNTTLQNRFLRHHAHGAGDALAFVSVPHECPARVGRAG